uniref:Uncharacterized protein LOC101493892 n=1 Tax=Cicer arietinum TaxID=3827 RepID=A0A3Q7YGT1_CICAR|nr:uncharacterized protein LOC101493892 [Cicer arietinum]
MDDSDTLEDTIDAHDAKVDDLDRGSRSFALSTSTNVSMSMVYASIAVSINKARLDSIIRGKLNKIKSISNFSLRKQKDRNKTLLPPTCSHRETKPFPSARIQSTVLPPPSSPFAVDHHFKSQLIEIPNISFQWYPIGNADQSVHLVAGEGLEAYLPLADMVDISAEVQRISKHLSKMQKEYEGFIAKLNSPKFVEKAPDLYITLTNLCITLTKNL